MCRKTFFSYNCFSIFLSFIHCFVLSVSLSLSLSLSLFSSLKKYFHFFRFHSMYKCFKCSELFSVSLPMYPDKQSHGWSPGLVAMGWDLCLRDCEFESQWIIFIFLLLNYITGLYTLAIAFPMGLLCFVMLTLFYYQVHLNHFWTSFQKRYSNFDNFHCTQAKILVKPLAYLE